MSTPRHLRNAKSTRDLIGEKLLNFIRASDRGSSWAAKLPLFVGEIRRVFTPQELREYFASTRHVGAAAHVCTEEQYRTIRDAGAFDEDILTGAADAILFERAREVLLSGPTPADTT